MKNIATMREDVEKLFKDHEIDYFVVGWVADGQTTMTQTQGDATMVAQIMEALTGDEQDLEVQVAELEGQVSELEDEVSDLEVKVSELESQLEIAKEMRD